MDINLNNISKRFRFEWIFRGINQTIRQGETWALLGPNGSGKSTLMKVLSGHLTPSKGKITFSEAEKIDIEAIYSHISIAAPYVELIEEFTLLEILDFHQKFKPFQADLDSQAVIELLGFSSSAKKPLRFFSSGMKQRLKLALALCSESPLILLDEPTTNLDEQGVAWYHSLIKRFAKGKTLIIASNVLHDYDFCAYRLSILDYK